MGTWYNKETTELKETIDESENEDGFRIGGGYSSDRGHSRHNGAWQTGKLRDKKMPGGEKGESSDSSDDKDESSTDLHSPNWKSPPLFSVPAAGSSGSPARNTRSGAMARRATSEKGQKKKKK
jgi:hypothetical protein